MRKAPSVAHVLSCHKNNKCTYLMSFRTSVSYSWTLKTKISFSIYICMYNTNIYVYVYVNMFMCAYHVTLYYVDCTHNPVQTYIKYISVTHVTDMFSNIYDVMIT